jgi:hypothetical protein
VATPRTSQRGQVAPLIALALSIAAVAVVAVVFFTSRPNGSAGTAEPTPTATPTVSTPGPTTSTPATPSPVPSASPSSVIGEIKLQSGTGQDVTLKVDDESGDFVAAESGTPGDGMSVRWHDAIVSQSGTHSISITWAALPQDDDVDLAIVRTGDAYAITIVQGGPVAYSDAMGEDRVVVLTFVNRVAARDVTVEVLDRTVD